MKIFKNMTQYKAWCWRNRNAFNDDWQDFYKGDGSLHQVVAVDDIKSLRITSRVIFGLDFIDHYDACFAFSVAFDGMAIKDEYIYIVFEDAEQKRYNFIFYHNPIYVYSGKVEVTPILKPVINRECNYALSPEQNAKKLSELFFLLREEKEYTVYIRTSRGIVKTHVSGNFNIINHSRWKRYDALPEFNDNSDNFFDDSKFLDENIESPILPEEKIIEYTKERLSKYYSRMTFAENKDYVLNINKTIEEKILSTYGIGKDSKNHYFLLRSVELPKDVDSLNFQKYEKITDEETFLNKSLEGWILKFSSIFSREIIELCLSVKEHYFSYQIWDAVSLLKKLNEPYYNPLNPKSFDLCLEEEFNFVESENTDNLFIAFLQIIEKKGREFLTDENECKRLLAEFGIKIDDLHLKLFKYLLDSDINSEIERIQKENPDIAKNALVFELYARLFGKQKLSNEYEIILIEQLKTIVDAFIELEFISISEMPTESKTNYVFEDWEHALVYLLSDRGIIVLENPEFFKNSLKDLLKEKDSEEISKLYDFIKRLNENSASYLNEDDTSLLAKFTEQVRYCKLTYAPLEKALTDCVESAEHGDKVAQFQLGMLYCIGKIFPPNLNFSYKWWTLSAEQGYSDAQYTLGILYETGRGIERNLETARKFYEKASEQGSSDAQQKLGDMYFAGRGVERDFFKAKALYEKSGKLEDAAVQWHFGIMYRDGKGVEKDFSKARDWFEKSAEQNNSVGQLCLGEMYYRGQGVSHDYKKARELLEKSSQQGNIYAKELLGEIYRDGKGVKQDFEKARMLFEESARKGNSYALFALGTLYVKVQNIEKALYFFEKAANAGIPYAQEAIAMIAEKISPSYGDDLFFDEEDEDDVAF